MYYQISVADLELTRIQHLRKPGIRIRRSKENNVSESNPRKAPGFEIRLLGIEGFIDGLRLVSVATQSEIEGCRIRIGVFSVSF